MIFTTSAAAILASALFSGTNAHMIMTQPTPYNFAKVSSSPLGGANGLAFPCQGPIDSTQPTEAKAGDAIQVKFGGSAVHGGGTCQFSVTYENPPPADPEKWKVLHTIVGGCPANAKQNLRDEPDVLDAHGRPAGVQCAEGQTTECLPTFSVPISKDVKNGEATFAWTWFNAIGNREMYMNCAPITISGGKDDDSGMANFPSMFMANVDQKPCTTTEQVLDLSTVGGSVEVIVEAKPESLGTCTITSGGAGGDGNADTPPPAPAPTPSTPANPGNELAENPVTDTPGAPPAPSQPETPAPSGGDQVSCPTNGVNFCIGATQWGACNFNLAIPREVPPGTVCVGDGQFEFPSKKRHVHRHLRPHPRSFI